MDLFHHIHFCPKILQAAEEGKGQAVRGRAGIAALHRNGYISLTSMHLSGQTSTQLMQPTHSPA